MKSDFNNDKTFIDLSISQNKTAVMNLGLQFESPKKNIDQSLNNEN